MPYGTYFTSIDPVRRRMAASAESVSPGFPAIISAVNEDKRTVDVWVQGSTYTLKNVPYPSQFKTKPDYIDVGQVVYIRYAYGNKFRIEVAGASLAFPSSNPQSGAQPTQPNSDPDLILSGLAVRESSTSGMYVAVTTGRARLTGSTYDFEDPLLGQDISARITGATITTLLVGAAGTLDQTYCYIPIDPADPTYFRYDNIELGGHDQKINYRPGTAGITPAPLSVQANHILLATILIRPGATRILSTDINAAVTFNFSIDVVPDFIEMVGSSANKISYFIVSIKDASGQSVAGHPIMSIVTGSGGACSPSMVTNASGYAIFIFTMVTGPTQSCKVLFKSMSSDAFKESRVIIYDALGVPYPLP